VWCGGARELSIGALHASIEDFLLDLQAAAVSVPIITPGPVVVLYNRSFKSWIFESFSHCRFLIFGFESFGLKDLLDLSESDRYCLNFYSYCMTY
jgi:hypothetical protein